MDMMEAKLNRALKESEIQMTYSLVRMPTTWRRLS
jgi:hypothetical protein